MILFSFLCIDAKKYKSKVKNGEVKYTYTAVFSVKKEKNNNIDFSTVINVYKKYIDNFFQGGPRKDLFENENRNTNSLREKRHQQVLFSEHLDVTGELLFYDMELSLPKPKEKSNFSPQYLHSLIINLFIYNKLNLVFFKL